MRRKIFIKNLVGIFSSMMLPIVIMAVIIFFTLNNYVKNEISSINKNLLDQSKEISQLIFGSFNAVNLVISSDQRMVSSLRRLTDDSLGFDSGDITKISDLTNFVNSFTATSPYIESVYVYVGGNNKRFYSSKHGISAIDTFADNTWFGYIGQIDFRDDITAERFIKRYSFEKADKEIISVYRKLFGKDGVVVMNIDADKLRGAMEKFIFQKQQSIVISDQNGSFHLHTQADYLDDAYISDIMRDGRESFTYTSDKVDYVVSKLPLNQNGWIFTSVIPKKSLYSLQSKLLFAMLPGIVICFIIGTFMSVRVVRKNFKNINAILYAIEAAESGQAYDELPSRSDEYNYIIRNIIQNGILRQYMQVQLSEKKYMMQNLELTALQCQINPHFLVNTLKTIYWKSVSAFGMGGELPKMIENLSDVVGYSLTDPMTLVKMEKEIAHTQSFVEILQSRHTEEMTVIWDCAGNIQEIYTEKLILQPLIENAYYHGLRYRKTPGKIKVKIRIRNADILIQVTDNGVGMQKERLNQVRESMAAAENISGEHIGLVNTHKRIRLKFGEKYGIRILSKAGHGTSVTLRFPENQSLGAPPSP